ncbi:unnamed protein product [Leptospira phage LE1]|uniref:Uncharacterized protein n=1 Tax=Leptospira phage LE1 TaxID=137511 RepID=Q6NE07_9CAUD|nr:hypothetical protein HWD53_gp36 [Leptospira phage LE1]CAE14716.1 unnamed protein product [Leptospira phage LE1]
MKNLLFLLLFLTITSSIFSKDEKTKETLGNDLVCKQIRIIAGDDSPMVKMLSELTNPKSEGGMLAMGGVVRCENSTSICYGASGSALSCHKK